MNRMRTILALASAAVAAAALVGATCSTNEECPCFPCMSAVALTVLDQDGNPLNEPWVMAATLDGVAVDDGGACDPDLRTGNSCAFGNATGVYRIVVDAPGYAPREAAARCAAATGQDCCMGACVNETQVVVRLLPESP
ncbi:MAG: hypothetical protein A2138_17370 [Deltaproteobacteria bacterium RBG_16_71_12]|nr:MAG: hypothetical protein A2138_17370 [Deltaproteobacteria bacterium RBG_16_71_12]